MQSRLVDQSNQVSFEAYLTEVGARFEAATATEVIEWAVGTFGDRLSLACSFQDLVVLDLALSVDPVIEVVFLDTGEHFSETLQFLRAVTERRKLNLVVLRPGPEAEAWPCGTARCCELRKVVPLRAHLADRDAWMTGIRRAESPTRAQTPVVSWDPTFGVAKVNPLATWSDEEVTAYLRDRRLPLHPLVSRGYRSIGCAPTTAPVADGQHGRAGRWSGLDKTECGLHSSAQ